MSPSTFRYIAFALIAIGIIVAVYYFIPGYHHVILLTLGGKASTASASDSRPLHALVGVVIAIVGVAVLFLMGRKKATA